MIPAAASRANPCVCALVVEGREQSQAVRIVCGAEQHGLGEDIQAGTGRGTIGVVDDRQQACAQRAVAHAHRRSGVRRAPPRGLVSRRGMALGVRQKAVLLAVGHPEHIARREALRTTMYATWWTSPSNGRSSASGTMNLHESVGIHRTKLDARVRAGSKPLPRIFLSRCLTAYPEDAIAADIDPMVW